MQAVHALVANGSTMMEAYQHISAEFAIIAADPAPLLRRREGFDDCDWLAVLVPKQQQAATESRAARLAPRQRSSLGVLQADYLRRRGSLTPRSVASG